MKLKKSIELDKEALSKFLRETLKLDDKAEITFNIGLVGNQRDEWHDFKNVTITTIEDLKI